MKTPAYIFSVAPYEASRKILPYGPLVIIAAKPKGERYSVTEIQPSECFKDFGEGQIERYPIPAIDIARDVVAIDCPDQGVWASESPTPSEEDIVAAEARQRSFYEKHIYEADGIWAKTGDPTRIPFHARIGARDLNVRREWAKDTSTMTPCKGCRELISNDAVKCGRCGAVLNWEAAVELGMVSPEQYDFAKRRGLNADGVAKPAATKKAAK